MPTVDVLNVRGTTLTASSLPELEHLLRRGFAPVSGSVAAARAAFGANYDAPAALETYASDALKAAFVALPAGGSEGQALIKSGTSLAWGSISSGGGSGTPITDLPLVFWGDSLTANWSGTNRLTPLITASGRTGKDNQTFGIGSQKSDQIAARQGGQPARLTGSVTIPAGTGTVAATPTVDLLQGTGVATSGTRSIPCSIMGVRGTLTATNPGTTPWTYTFARTTAGASAVTAPAGTPIQMSADYHEHIPVIWTGRNSALLGGATTSIPALIEAMLKNSQQRDRALVLSIPPSSTETSGTADRTTLDAVNAAIRDAFPAQFVDAAAYLRDAAVIAAAGYTLTGQDTTDIGNGVTPTQLRISGDTLHLDDPGYIVLDRLITAELSARGLVAFTAPAITSGTPVPATTGSGYLFPFTASGTGTITWAVTSGALPAGLTLAAATGVLSGTPTAAGSSTFTVTATNSAGTVSQSYTLVVAASVGVTYTSDSFTGGPAVTLVGRTTDAALGGTGKAWSVSSGLNRFAINGSGRLVAGDAPQAATAGVATGFTDAAAQITVVAGFAAAGTTCMLAAARSTLGNTSVDEIAARIQSAAGGAMTAQISTKIAGTQTLGSTTAVVPGDVVWVGIQGTTVTLKVNGTTVSTATYGGTKPSAYAGFTAGGTTETTWALDDFKVINLT